MLLIGTSDRIPVTIGEEMDGTSGVTKPDCWTASVVQYQYLIPNIFLAPPHVTRTRTLLGPASIASVQARPYTRRSHLISRLLVVPLVCLTPGLPPRLA
jgi:hypothetical protein